MFNPYNYGSGGAYNSDHEDDDNEDINENQAQEMEEIAILKAMRQPIMTYPLVSQGNEAILKLAERMKRIFFTIMKRYEDSHKGSEIKIMTRQSSSDPYRAVFFASTSYPVPIPHTTLVDSLRDEKNRVKNVNINQREMRILQASSIDPMFLIYSPVDSVAMDNAINGGDSDNVPLLPSGFAIYPGGTGGEEGGGCLIKLAFHVMIDVDPSDTVAARASAAAVNVEQRLIRAAMEKIKTLLPC